MANKTLIPAFRCVTGGENYYVCKLTFAEAVRRIGVESNVDNEAPLDAQLRRTTDLLPPIVAVCDGHPLFTPFQSDSDAPVSPVAGARLGLLTIAGIDGLTAIHGADSIKTIDTTLRKNRDRRGDSVCVIIVKKDGDVSRRAATAAEASQTIQIL